MKTIVSVTILGCLITGIVCPPVLNQPEEGGGDKDDEVQYEITKRLGIYYMYSVPLTLRPIFTAIQRLLDLATCIFVSRNRTPEFSPHNTKKSIRQDSRSCTINILQDLLYNYKTVTYCYRRKNIYKTEGPVKSKKPSDLRDFYWSGLAEFHEDIHLFFVNICITVHESLYRCVNGLLKLYVLKWFREKWIL